MWKNSPVPLHPELDEVNTFCPFFSWHFLAQGRFSVIQALPIALAVDLGGATRCRRVHDNSPHPSSNPESDLNGSLSFVHDVYDFR